MNDQRTSSQNLGHRLPSYTVPLYDTTALTSALANPYAQHYAPHYYQAYMQAFSNMPRTTGDGYTLSSTYVPGTGQTSRATSSLSIPLSLDQSSEPACSQTAVKPIKNHLTFGSWYQPGNCRCTRKGCPFSGSRKSVEIHMMDRHFIFPPGWKNKNDWDADPSLRGKRITIQGTSVVLDTPEAVDAWIAERRRRFPTDERIQEKKRKLEEAAARGQLTPEEMGASARKKHRPNVTLAEDGGKKFRRQGHQRGRGRRRRDLGRREELKTQVSDDPTSQRTCAKIESVRETSPNPGSSADDDEAPEVVSSKIPRVPSCSPNIDAEGNDGAQETYPQEYVKRILPKKPPRNPFASRPTLLRNLLLPEIRVTVSNLSQAIHFLVENDFLRGVELRPGQAQEQMIEVLTPRKT